VRVYLDPIADPIENKRRARHLLQGIKEFGLEAVSDGPDHFDVKLPRGFKGGNAAEFLESIREAGARGVSIQADDIKSSGLFSDQPFARKQIEELVSSGAVDPDHIPSEDLNETLTAWERVAMKATVELSEEEEERIYNEIVAQLPKPETAAERYARDVESDPWGLKEMDKYLEEHADEHPGWGASGRTRPGSL